MLPAITGRWFVAYLRLAVLCLCINLLAVQALAQVPFVGMGDSIGEGVQSADASYPTQANSFLNFIAWRMGVPFPLPYIISGPLLSISSVSGRIRYDPALQGRNLAVSGA